MFLSQYSETPVLYNSMACAISDFCNFAAQNDIQFFEIINPPLLPVKQRTSIRRAPDQCVVDVLDHFFFTTDDIPIDIKCAYLLLRLILNRISEVLNMSIDCISYPANNENEHSAQTVEHLQIELETQKQKIRTLQKELNKTKQLLQASKQSYAELNREYQKLLGRYQTDIRRKIIHIYIMIFLQKNVAKSSDINV